MFYSIWLAVEELELKRLVDEICYKEKTFSFLPHITLVGGIKTDTEKDKEIISVLQSIKKEINENESLILTVKEIQFSSIFTKTLYLTFANSQPLTLLRKKVEIILNKNNFNQFNPDFSPHLSLLYKNLSLEKLKKLKEELVSKIPKIIKVTNLIAIKEEKPIKKPEDVKNWIYLKI
jgi:2'-5' RNA ligase